MVFSSIIFLFAFLPLVLIGYHLNEVEPEADRADHGAAYSAEAKEQWRTFLGAGHPRRPPVARPLKSARSCLSARPEAPSQAAPR